ncbi:hypothetical protein [Pseudomonas sp. RIT-PI-q]|uniref:hypothetical protein n=1 Tax=Pseudomonas sp. RIT-PI-q TaxID=1690247 RepID=UPI0007512F0B|nr:hypothetical protein [Pseudomonas sp. RIT-PI-q]
MADEGYVPGQTYNIRPLKIIGGREQTYGPGGGGGYSGNSGGWGLEEGPDKGRGRGGPGTIHDIALPSVMAEFMNDQIYGQSQIENEYSARFSSLPADTERELEAKKTGR